MNIISKTISIATWLRENALCHILGPFLKGDLVLTGRPTAHQEEPMRALHSAMLQAGMSCHVQRGTEMTNHLMGTNYCHEIVTTDSWIEVVLHA